MGLKEVPKELGGDGEGKMTKEELKREMERIWLRRGCRHPGHKVSWSIQPQKAWGALKFWSMPSPDALVGSRGQVYPKMKKPNNFRHPPRYPPGFWEVYSSVHYRAYKEAHQKAFEEVTKQGGQRGVNRPLIRGQEGVPSF